MNIYHKLFEFSSKNTSLYPIIFGCLIDAKNLTFKNKIIFIKKKIFKKNKNIL